ncbi:MAG: hypothetical protein B6226_00055 [Candidatus Cloacimonetes bacterium 4572_65]|nr:MAG: hypothetical protein B6226_00055 [Candidatus Cloacimonetes bacterium 4572_65]
MSYDNLFIGRDNLLYSVVKLIDITVTKCKNMVINIYGKDGVGKTRLAAEMVARFGREEYSWVYTACDQVLKQNSNPIINFFLHYFSIAEHDEYHISHSKIVKTFEKLAENVSNKALIHELNQGIVFIEALLGIVELDNEHIDSEVAKNRHENTFFALTNIFRLMSLNRPVVFFIDNSDDLDEETKDFLTYFIPLVEDYPIFIILLSRDKQSETVTKIKKINSADLIWSKTQGNVFFIEQIINYVKRENLIDSDHKLITSELDIPEDVNSMILTRVDKLDDTLKLVIKTAAVLGVKFNITTLKHMMGGTDVAKYIAEGESENLWEASSRNNYLFRNSLLRDSIYHLLLKSHVKNIHFKAVYTIEKIYQENLSEHYDELIYNSINGELVDKSIEYLIKAGDLAKKLHHHASALSYFTKLINYIADKPIEKETIIIDSNLKFVDIYLEDGNLEKAGEILADITANDLSSDFFIKKYDYLHTKLIFLQEKHRKLLNHLSPKLNSLTNNEYKNFYLIYYLDSLRFLSMNGEFENMAAELIEQHSNDDNDFFVGRVVNLMGVYYMEKGQYFEALQNFKLNFNLIESEENYRFLASGAHNIGTIYHKLGDKEQAIVYYRRALKIAEDTGNRITKCKVLCDIALVEQRENHTDNAIQKLNRALDIATLIQNDNQKSKIYYNLSQINYGKRNFDEALINCLLAKSIGEKLNNRLTTSYVNSLLGKIYFAVGKVSQAKEILLLNIEHQKEIGDSEGLANSYVILAIEANSCKEFNSADKYYSKSFDILHKLGNKKAEGSCLYNWAVCDYEQLKYQEAIAKLNEVISIFTECDYSVGSRAANSLLNSLKKSNIAD